MKSNKKVTIVEVAQMAGVSVSTVSRVLNHKDMVDLETRTRVEEIIQKCNYTPNRLAQSLVNQRSKTIALIIPDVSNPFFADIVHGVENVCTEHEYSMFLFNSNFDHDKESHFLTEMVNRQVDGAVIISAFLQNQELIHQLNNTCLNIVCIQTQIDGIDRINTNDYDGMCQSIQRLIDLGHKRIGFMCIDRRGCRARFSAYCDTLKKNEIEYKEEYIVESIHRSSTDNPGYHMAKTLLSLPEPPTAVQALNDYLASGIYQAVYESGKRIPQDLSVVGYDDIPLSKLLMPPLTTVHQPAHAMGEAGCELLLKNIAKTDASASHECREIVFTTRFIERDSIAPPHP